MGMTSEIKETAHEYVSSVGESPLSVDKIWLRLQSWGISFGYWKTANGVYNLFSKEISRLWRSCFAGCGLRLAVPKC